MRTLSRRLVRDDKGVTALEFAFVGPIFIVMLMALLDMGHMLYAKSVLNGAVQKAGRDSSLQTGIQNAGAIDLAVKNTVLTVVPNAQMTFNRKKLYRLFEHRCAGTVRRHEQQRATRSG